MEKLNLKKLDVTIYPDDLKEIGLFVFTFKESSKIYLIRGYRFEIKEKTIKKKKVIKRIIDKTGIVCRYYSLVSNEVSREDFILNYPFSIYPSTVDIYSIDDVENFK